MAQPDGLPCRSVERQMERFGNRQRLELALAVTLPFEQGDVSRKLFQLAIDQTRKRWAWFANLRELDTKLGTELGTSVYLPWEIRQQSRWYSSVYNVNPNRKEFTTFVDRLLFAGLGNFLRLCGTELNPFRQWLALLASQRSEPLTYLTFPPIRHTSTNCRD